MADAAVTFVLNQLSVLIREEYSLLGGIGDDAQDVKTAFDRLTAVLRVADETEEIDPQVKAWVKIVRELAYDAEDVLDEFLFRFGGRRSSVGFYAKIKNIYTSVKNLRGRLQNLETLDLKQTDVIELPKEILKLCKLRHLLLYRYQDEWSNPWISMQSFNTPKIGELLSLQKLCFIQASDTNVVSEIGKLTQLRKLGVTRLRHEDASSICRSSSSSYITIDRASGKSTSMVILTYLDLSKSYEGEGLCFKAKKFSKLKHLFIRDCPALKWIRIEEGALHHLENFYLDECKLLEQVPLGIHHLSNLKSFSIHDMGDKLMASLEQNGEDYAKISHIPKITISQIIDGGGVAAMGGAWLRRWEVLVTGAEVGGGGGCAVGGGRRKR
nr:disease resistance protein RPM1-like [Ipomoea batatas]